MLDAELVEAAFWFAVTFAACEFGAVVVAVTLAWVLGDCILKGR